MGVAFRRWAAGAPGTDYLGRTIVGGKGAPTMVAACMGLTSFRWFTIAVTLAHRASSEAEAQVASCTIRWMVPLRSTTYSSPRASSPNDVTSSRVSIDAHILGPSGSVSAAIDQIMPVQ